MARRHPDLPEFLSRISLISCVYMPLSSPSDVGCEDETHVRETDGWMCSPLSPIFGSWWCWSLLELHPESHHQKDRLPLENSTCCAMNAHFTYLVRFFLLTLLWAEHNWSPLSCTQKLSHQYLHDLLKFWTVVNAVTQYCHSQLSTTKFT